MADRRTLVTELVTGLATLGHDSVGDALAARPPEMVSVSPALWDELDALYAGRGFAQEFEAAWANGRALLRAGEGLRGRRPLVIEWRGGVRPQDDEPVPADLRIDHVFLVSCKYLSDVVLNVAPGRLFDGLLRVREGVERSSWFATVAPAEHAALLAAACAHAGVEVPGDRAVLRESLRGTRWPASCTGPWEAMVAAVSDVSAARWRAALDAPSAPLRLLWRLLRVGPAPYFILGVNRGNTLRLRVMTTWDWSQRYELRAFDVEPGGAGQPVVKWRAELTDRVSRTPHSVHGHVEIRWSHGRFNGAPEAKVYLDVPHASVPGYVPLR